MVVAPETGGMGEGMGIACAHHLFLSTMQLPAGTKTASEVLGLPLELGLLPVFLFSTHFCLPAQQHFHVDFALPHFIQPKYDYMKPFKKNMET